MLQRLRGLKTLEKKVVRMGVSDSREKCISRVAALSKHALKWVRGKQGLATEVNLGL
jgi:hypothetical protein